MLCSKIGKVIWIIETEGNEYVPLLNVNSLSGNNDIRWCYVDWTNASFSTLNCGEWDEINTDSERLVIKVRTFRHKGKVGFRPVTGHMGPKGE